MHVTIFEMIQTTWNKVNTLALYLVATALLIYALFAGYTWLAVACIVFMLLERLLLQAVVYFMSISLYEISTQMSNAVARERHGAPYPFNQDEQ
jgi:hypothetical protein